MAWEGVWESYGGILSMVRPPPQYQSLRGKARSRTSCEYISRIKRVFRLGREVGQGPAGEGEMTTFPWLATPPDLHLSSQKLNKVMKPHTDWKSLPGAILL